MFMTLCAWLASPAMALTCSGPHSPGEVASCTTDLPADGLLWRLGDGRTVEDTDTIRETFEPGNYSISLTHDAGTEYAEVVVCDAPLPEFTFLYRGYDRYRMDNVSDFQPGCVLSRTWTLHRGSDADGEVVQGPMDVWSPEFIIPEDGTYTAKLVLDGFGGKQAAALTFDAYPRRREDLASGCNTNGSSGLWLGLLSLAWVRRRSPFTPTQPRTTGHTTGLW